MRRTEFDKKTASLSKKRKRRKKRGRILIITALVLAAAIALTVSAGAVRVRQLRAEMEGHIADAAALIDSGRFRTALTDATQALALAEKLRDSVSVEEIELRIRLIQSVILGNDLFEAGNYQQALQTYRLAMDYALKISGEGSDFIEKQIAAAIGYIHFFDLIERAESLADSLSFDAALELYEDARSAAAAMSFAGGVNIAAAGIEEMNERILMAKRAAAAELVSQGDACVRGGYFTESFIFFQAALTIYQELEDSESIVLINARIRYAERLLEERERLEEEQRAKEEAEKEAAKEDAANSQGGQGGQGGQSGEGGEGGEGEQGGQGETDGNDGKDLSELEMNYEHNSGIFFDLKTMIDNQRLRPANQVKMGTRENRNEGWYNGCGWVASYNALILLGDPRHPADIVMYIETNRGAVLGGVLGTYPHAIEAYFKSLGYSVNHVLFPQLSTNIDNAIKEAGVGILAYAHTRAAHYVMVEYREEDGRYIVYNDNFARAMSKRLGYENDSSSGAVIDSVTALIRNTPDILFSFSLITISPAPAG